MKPTPEEVEKGLTDADEGVRCTMAKRTDFIPTPEQVERGLTDPWSLVREKFAFRTDFTPTTEQVERVLTDEECDVVMMELWMGRARELASASLIDESIADYEQYSI